MAGKADQLAQEMSRFEQEIFSSTSGSSGPQPLFSNLGRIQRDAPPGPPPGAPPGPPPGGPPRGPAARPPMRTGAPIGPPRPPHGPPRPPPGAPAALHRPSPGALPRPPPRGPAASRPPPRGLQRPPPRALGGPPRPPQGALDMFNSAPFGQPVNPHQVPPPDVSIPPPALIPSRFMPRQVAPAMPVPLSLQPAPAPMMLPLPVPSLSGSSSASAETPSSDASAKVVPVKPLKAMKMKKDPKKLRMGGGKVWEDHSLDDWVQDDFRIFVGDLGNDVNDDTLARSFSKYSSFLKAKVIRDKYTKKTKGYGFVSFKTPQDFMQAMKEMDGKYIGNRPIKLRKSTWKDRSFVAVKKKEKEKKRLGFR